MSFRATPETEYPGGAIGGGVSVFGGRTSEGSLDTATARRIAGVAVEPPAWEGSEGEGIGVKAGDGAMGLGGVGVGVEVEQARDRAERTKRATKINPQPLAHPAQPKGATVTFVLPQRGHRIETAFPFGYQV